MNKDYKTMKMKRVLATCLLLIGLTGFVTCHADDRQQYKAFLKECKKQAKQLTKEGWTVWGASQTIEDAMKMHLEAMQGNGGNTIEIKGHGLAMTENVALTKAKNNANVQYAQIKGTDVESIEKRKVASETGSETSTTEHYEATSNLKSKHLVRKMIPTVTLMRTLANGTYEALVYYVVEKVMEDSEE
jgi:hypothetical protein